MLHLIAESAFCICSISLFGGVIQVHNPIHDIDRNEECWESPACEEVDLADAERASLRLRLVRPILCVPVEAVNEHAEARFPVFVLSFVPTPASTLQRVVSVGVGQRTRVAHAQATIYVPVLYER